MEKDIQGNISLGIESTPGSGVDSTDFVRQNPMLAIPVDSSPQGRKIFSGSILYEKAPATKSGAFSCGIRIMPFILFLP